MGMIITRRVSFLKDELRTKLTIKTTFHGEHFYGYFIFYPMLKRISYTINLLKYHKRDYQTAPTKSYIFEFTQ